ncbi:MAG TPA: hypothetical protein VEI49_01455 [Terriglobales bacterium]|nr:hypothetical protein [Terriglobales bacterium]
MKRASSVVCAILLLGSIMSSAGGAVRPITLKLRADVPFDFMVQRTMFPAGKYVVRQTPGGMLSLKAEHGVESISVVGEAMQRDPGSQWPSLVFVKENGHFHLREVWMTASFGRELQTGSEPLHTASLARVEISADCDHCE